MTDYPEHIRDEVLKFRKLETSRFAIELQKKTDQFAKQLLAEHEARLKQKKQQHWPSYQYTEYDYSKQKSSSQNNTEVLNSQNLLSDYIITQSSFNPQGKINQHHSQVFTPTKEPVYVVVVGCESQICHIRGCGIIKLKQQKQISKDEVMLRRLCQQCQTRLDKGTY